MSSDKLFHFCIGGIFSILLLMVLQEYNKLERQSAYQQGIIDSQKQWLEFEKGDRN